MTSPIPMAEIAGCVIHPGPDRRVDGEQTTLMSASPTAHSGIGESINDVVDSLTMPIGAARV